MTVRDRPCGCLKLWLTLRLIGAMPGVPDLPEDAGERREPLARLAEVEVRGATRPRVRRYAQQRLDWHNP